MKKVISKALLCFSIVFLVFFLYTALQITFTKYGVNGLETSAVITFLFVMLALFIGSLVGYIILNKKIIEEEDKNKTE